MSTRIPFQKIPQGLMASMMAGEAYTNEQNFAATLLELIRLHVSNVNHCAYCIDMHFKEGLAADETEQRLYSVSAWRDAPYYSPQERACLAWAEYITQPTAQHDEQTLFENLLAYFEETEIANLTLVVIQINAWNRLMKAFAIEAGHYQVGQYQ